MTIDVTKVAARHLGRPVLMEPAAAAHLMGRIRAIDPNFTARSSRIGALVRKLAGAARNQIVAMDDDDDRVPPPSMSEIGAYHPLYVGEVDDQGFCWTLKDGIALLQCDTPLLERGEVFCGAVWHGYDTLLAAMREAAADERVKALFLRAASPGGVVAGGLDSLAIWMRANRAAAGGKPIWVYADQACSAMYWISAQADRIVAPDVGMIGSIGAVLIHEDWSGALAEAGIKVTAIQFGAKKTDGNWWESLSPRAQQDLQAEIDQCGRNFIAAVAAGRPAMSEDKQLATEAGVFLGRHDDPTRSALALGLCDDIMGEEAAFIALANSISGAAPVSPSTLASAAGARTKEQPMAKTAEQKAARLAALKEEQTTTPAIDETPNPDEGEEENPTPAPDEEPDDKPAATAAAKAIAESQEAKAHPKQALAAISAGLTLDQFKAMVADIRPTGRLSEAMAGAPRLNADAPAGGGKVHAPLDPRAIYDRRRTQSRQSRAG